MHRALAIEPSTFTTPTQRTESVGRAAHRDRRDARRIRQGRHGHRGLADTRLGGSLTDGCGRRFRVDSVASVCPRI